MLVEVNSMEELEKVIQGNKNVLLDFWASWCEPCKQMMPSLEKVSLENEGVTFCKIKVDDNKDIARKYRVMSVPTLITIKNQDVVTFSSGFKTENDISKFLKDFN